MIRFFKMETFGGHVEMVIFKNGNYNLSILRKLSKNYFLLFMYLNLP